jgi:molybdopterin-guanine dinucleotide biosynthesis protein A
VDRAVRILSGDADEVLVALREARAFRGARVVRDRLDPPCALAGLHAVLVEMRNEAAFVCACDMPYLNPDLIRFLVARLGDHPAVVPEGPGGLEPLHAVYSRKCVPALEAALREGRRSARDFAAAGGALVVPVDEREWRVLGASPFENVNRPEDFESFRRRLEGNRAP